MSDDDLKGRADALLALHRPGDPVILPTVWDAWSARMAVAAGFAALSGRDVSRTGLPIRRVSPTLRCQRTYAHSRHDQVRTRAKAG